MNKLYYIIYIIIIIISLNNLFKSYNTEKFTENITRTQWNNNLGIYNNYIHNISQNLDLIDVNGFIDLHENSIDGINKIIVDELITDNKIYKKNCDTNILKDCMTEQEQNANPWTNLNTCLQSDYIQSEIGTFNNEGKRRIVGCMNQYKDQANELWKKSSAAVIKDNSIYFESGYSTRHDFPKFTYKYNSFIGQLFKISIPNLNQGVLFYYFTGHRLKESKAKYAKSFTVNMLNNFCPIENRYKYGYQGPAYWCDSKDVLNDKYNYTKIHKNIDSSPEGYTFSYDDTIDPNKRPNDTSDFESTPDVELIDKTDLFKSYCAGGCTDDGYMSHSQGKSGFKVK